MTITKHDALEYHRQGRPGKIEVVPSKPVTSQRELSLAYTPGVADAVIAIKDDPLEVYSLTAKSNLVGVVSNGTAILGLGNLGPEASKPVMEGKGVLFKRFADIDVFDIEINASSADEIVASVRSMAPTFGGINLEDIKAPECFEVEQRLRAELDIPVFHDDQHGTAIITGAALLNALEITGKDIAKLKIVIVGAGAAGIASGEFYVSLGVKRENVTMVDIHGVVYKGREVEMDPYKEKFAQDTPKRTLAEALEGADMVLGLSAGNVIKPEMLPAMNPSPIIFALANPNPEIMPDVCRAARPDAIIATGRTDFPNQVNNVLGFPAMFRGALDVYATQINEAMKLAACRALARLAHEDVPDGVLSSYSLKSLKYGPEYLIPKPFDPRVLLWVAPAVAKAAMESGVARRQIDLDVYHDELIRRQGYGIQFRYTLFNKVKLRPKQRIVFAEGEEPKIIRAAYRVMEDGIGQPILLGDPAKIRAAVENLNFNWEPPVVNPATDPKRDMYFEQLYQQRQRKGANQHIVRSMLRSVNFYGPMMVRSGDADAFVSGLTREYPDVARPALQLFGTKPGTRHASGVYIMVIKGRVYFFTDTTINIDPNAATLAEIAILANDFAKSLDFTPRVAMLSFSNFGSVRHALADKMRDAVELVQNLRPDIAIDGEMQADTAVVEKIVEDRFPFSRVRDANVLVFPGLSSANIAYKLLARLTDAEAIGPVLLGMGWPCQVLQAGDDVDSIVALTAFAALDAQRRAAGG